MRPTQDPDRPDRHRRQTLALERSVRDAGTGLYYLCARYYNPDTAQFLTIDPDVNSTQSPYGYVAGDPLDNADPTGLFQYCGPKGNGPCMGVGETAPEVGACYHNGSSSMCQKMQSEYAGWVASGGGNCQKGDICLATTFSICATSTFAEACLSESGGHGYFQAGPGLGLGATFSVHMGGVTGGCPAQLIEGWSINAGAQYGVGVGWSQTLSQPSDQGARGPDFSVGGGSVGAYATHGWQWW